MADDEFLLFVTADPADFRMRGVASGPEPLFLGIAPTSAVDAYLEDVAHDEIVELGRYDESKQILDIRYTTHEGKDAPGTPSTETFWVRRLKVPDRRRLIGLWNPGTGRPSS